MGKIAYKEWGNTPNIRPNVKLHEFVIMPNHIHGIIEILYKKGKQEKPGKFKSPSQTIGSIIRDYKIATIKQIKDLFGKGELQFAPNRSTESTPPDHAPSRSTEDAPPDHAPDQTSDDRITLAIEKIKSLDFKIWQRNYYEIIIRDERAYENISNYILNNPKKWDEDKFYKNKA